VKHKLDKMRETTSEELVKRLAEIKESLFRLNFRKALGNTDTVAQIRRDRKEIARIKTLLRGRTVGVEK